MSLMHLHPIIVHFPIALVLVGFLTDLIYVFYKKCDCLPKTALYLEVLGTLGAVVAVLSGLFGTYPTTGYANEVKMIHAGFAIMTTIVLVVAVLLRVLVQKRGFCGKEKLAGESKDKRDNLLLWVSFTLMFVAVIGMTMTGMYGGKLVYDVWLSGGM